MSHAHERLHVGLLELPRAPADDEPGQDPALVALIHRVEDARKSRDSPFRAGCNGIAHRAHNTIGRPLHGARGERSKETFARTKVVEHVGMSHSGFFRHTRDPETRGTDLAHDFFGRIQDCRSRFFDRSTCSHCHGR
jgi:hypothetical protein